MMKLFRRNQNGFTLVELVVVIAILGILAAIAVPRFINAIDDANEAADAANMKALQGAVNMYYMASDPNAYPPADGTGVSETALVPDYLNEIPTMHDDTAYLYNATTGVVSMPAATP